MMADAWRELSSEDKQKYSVLTGPVTEEQDTELSLQQKKNLVLRVAKRHQGDVCSIQLYERF